MNRRDFIKTGSIGLAALGSGIGVGNILLNGSKEIEKFSVFSFLPEDKKLIIQCLRLFQHRIANNNFNNSLMNFRLNEIINKRFIVGNKDYRIFANSFVDVRLAKLEDKIRGDIFVSENSNLVLDPKKDFANSLVNFREAINKRNSDYLLSIEQKETNILSDLFIAQNKFISIENERGLFDKISLTKNYSSLIVPGNMGKTELEIIDGGVNIISSPCRHKLCKIMSQSLGNKTIACVPNKILIKMV